MSRVVKYRSSGFPTRSDTNRAVQPQKMARGLTFRIKIEEGLYHPCSKNKGTDQLHSYCAADLRLCFLLMLKAGFLMTRLKYTKVHAVLAIIYVNNKGAEQPAHSSSYISTFFVHC